MNINEMGLTGIALQMPSIFYRLLSKKGKFSEYLHTYWYYRDELTTESDSLMKNSKVLIPESLNMKYIDQILSGHTWINSCLKKARVFVSQKYYTDVINKAVEKCGICHSQQKKDFYSVEKGL